MTETNIPIIIIHSNMKNREIIINKKEHTPTGEDNKIIGIKIQKVYKMVGII